MSPLQYVVLSDFSPGIIHNVGWNSVGDAAGFSPGAAAPSMTGAARAAASMDNTYRCIALPGGGLGPLPRQDVALSDASWSSRLHTTANPWYVQFFVTPVVRSDDTAWVDTDFSGTGAHPVVFFVAGATIATTPRWQILAYKVFEDGFTNPDIMYGDSITASEGSVITPTYFAAQRFHDSVATTPGTPGITWVWFPDSNLAANEVADHFPDPAAPTTLVPKDWKLVGNLLEGGIPLGHQNRMVFFARGRHAFGSHFVQINDRLSFTNANLATYDADAVLNPEEAAGIGAWGSLSASDLLMIQHRSGALLVQGDLNAPIVRKLPGVASTNGTECVGSQTAMGFVYGTNRGGVHVWQGGDASISLSQQLPPDFWQSADAKNIRHFRGRFDVWDDWIMAPNGFVYSMSGQAWWRLDDPDSYAPYMYQPGPMGAYMYTCAPKVTATGDISEAVKGYNRALGATNWSWQSQPMFVSPNRRVRIREAILVAQGTGTVRLDISEADHTVTSTTFTLSGSTTVPQFFRETLGSHDLAMVRARLVADGGTSTAPLAYELRIGWEEAEYGAAVNTF